MPSGLSYRMVECSRLRGSNMRTEPSFPTDAKSIERGANAMSNTSLSCAMSCVALASCWMSQMVHVVSMLDVPSMFVSTWLQSNDVSGAQNSEFLLLFSTSFGRTHSP